MLHGNEVRTPNQNCPACLAKRIHREPEWKEFHPQAGTGIIADVARVNKA